MDYEALSEFVDAFPGSVAEYPFGPEARVSKVGGKMFALLADEPVRISLTCDPDLALELRTLYSAVEPGYHLNKRHWNTIDVAGDLPFEELEELIGHSYDLVASKLPKTVRDSLTTASAPPPD